MFYTDKSYHFNIVDFVFSERNLLSNSERHLVEGIRSYMQANQRISKSQFEIVKRLAKSYKIFPYDE